MRRLACVAALAGALLACGTRVSLGEVIPDERTTDGTSPSPSPSPSGSLGDDAGTAHDAGEPIDGGPGPIEDDAGDMDAGPAPYIPCAGKACGESCTICDPSDLGCFETAVLKECDENGACTASPATCN